MTTLPPCELAHVALHCADLAVMERFYRDVLGYSVVWQPDPDNCYLTRGRDSLALHAAASVGDETRLDHFGLVLADAESVDVWARHVQKLGVELDGPLKTHRDGTRSFYIRDPEGNRIQFLCLGPSMTMR